MADSSEKVKLVVRTLRRRLKRNPEFWLSKLAGHILLTLACLSILHSFSQNLSLLLGTGAGLLVAVVALELIFLYRLPEVDAPDAAHVIRDFAQLQESRIGEIGTLASRCLQLPQTLPLLLADERRVVLPMINTIDAALELLNILCLPKPIGEESQRSVRAFVVHAIPPWRAESYWWKTERGKEYFQLQRSFIENGRLQVRRLIVTEPGRKMTDEDYLEWFAQVQADMKVRWARLSEPAMPSRAYADFALVDTLDSHGEVVSTDAIIEVPSGDKRGPGQIHIARQRPGESLPEVLRLRSWFEKHWTQAAAEQIPSPSEWEKNRHRVPRSPSAGAIAFFHALQEIETAKDFIMAVDISDLKEGIQAIYNDSAYKAWYEATLNRGKEIGLTRVFVIRRSQKALEELLKNHLCNYYNEQGQQHKGFTVRVVLHDVIVEKIRGLRGQEVDDFFENHPNLRRHLEEHSEWHADDKRASLGALLLRDFLITENMIYDYRNPQAQFALEEMPDFLVLLEGERRSTVAEWQDVVDKLSLWGNGVTAATLHDLTAMLGTLCKEVAVPVVESRSVPSGALESTVDRPQTQASTANPAPPQDANELGQPTQG